MAAVNWDTLPLILAGPILRRTETGRVAVFFVLRKAATISLRVWKADADADAPPILEGREPTVALGARLHVAVVTATPRIEAPLADELLLADGATYVYDAAFAVTGPPTEAYASFNDVGVFGPADAAPGLGYPDATDRRKTLPSFTMPPPVSDLKDLRLLHASCRKPHGEGADMLPVVDDLIAASFTADGAPRPHLLLLMGDQIYADDVHKDLLARLMAIEEELLGWKELLPGMNDPGENDFGTDDLQPGKRADLVEDQAGVTAGGVAGSHLLTLGEYYGMYLLAWSPLLWPDAVADAGLNAFRAALPAVRRALANVPVYMIGDDHEVTDDWHLTLEWSLNVFGKPLGRRLLQNGLLAYAVMQAWGSEPAQFATGQPGRALLDAAAGWRADIADGYPADQAALADHLGIYRPDLPADNPLHRDQLRESKSLAAARTAPNSKILNWHYQVSGPGFQIIFLDTRTWREFGQGRKKPPALLGAAGRQAQLLDAFADPIPALTFVVSPGPVITTPFTMSAKRLVSRTTGDYEDWELDEQAWYAFLKLLGDRAAQGTQVVLLTGDIHYGCAGAIEVYQPTPPSLFAKLIHFTASALKNQDRNTRIAQAVGYEQWENRPARARWPRQVGRFVQDRAYIVHHIPADFPTVFDVVPEPPTESSGVVDWVSRHVTRDASPFNEVIGINNLGQTTLIGLHLRQTLFWRPGSEVGRPLGMTHYSILMQLP